MNQRTNNYSRDSSSSSSYVLNPQEEALQSLCKESLKSRLFRGFYVEKRYVDAPLDDYRAVIALHRSEHKLQKLLLSVHKKLTDFYELHTQPKWIGITNTLRTSDGLRLELPPTAAVTCIWTQMSEIALGQYWFSIKSVRFREREIQLKVKVVREVVPEAEPDVHREQQYMPADNKTDALQAQTADFVRAPATSTVSDDIGLQDFLRIFRSWGEGIKRTAYQFLAEDVNGGNIVHCLRLLGLAVVSIITFSFCALEQLGHFSLRFLFEFNRLVRTCTPIIMQIIDIFGKIIGGIFILLSMIWRDLMYGGAPKEHKPPALSYNQPIYRSIMHETQTQYRQAPSGRRNVDGTWYRPN